MTETIQVLTIIIDVLLVAFVFLLILIGWKLFRVVSAFSRLSRNLSDMRFWFNLVKSIPSGCRKKKD
ncbi:MAG: hypothetical protein AABZ14_06215 [Candidatus Margulisiibacteriota bacterium]